MSEISTEALKTVQQLHPDFRPRPKPDLNCYFIDEDSEGHSSTHESSEVPKPGVLIESILGRQRNGIDAFDFREKTYTIFGLVARDPEWGFEAQKYLIEQNVVEPLVWNSLYNGWRDAALDADQWSRWFEAQEELPNLVFAAEGISEVIETASRRKENCIPESLGERAFLLSLAAYNSLKDKELSLPNESKDWLDIAINRAGGHLAQFWLQYLSQSRSEAGENWIGMPERCRSLFKDVAFDTSETAALARVVLAGNLHFMFLIDPVFTREYLLPFLDWEKSQSTAEKCWQGYLGWGQWKKSFLSSVLPLYEKTLNYLDGFEDRTKESFVNHISAIAVYGYDDPIADGWLYKFIVKFDSTLRCRFARTIRKIMEGMSGEMVKNLWNRWLKRYWEDRLLNRAGALSEKEMNEMILWPLCAGEHFFDAVKMLKSSPRASRAPIDLKKDIPSLLFETLPDAVGEYLIIILECSRQGYFRASEILDQLPRLERAGLSSSVKDRLLNLLAKFS